MPVVNPNVPRSIVKRFGRAPIIKIEVWSHTQHTDPAKFTAINKTQVMGRGVFVGLLVGWLVGWFVLFFFPFRSVSSIFLFKGWWGGMVSFWFYCLGSGGTYVRTWQSPRTAGPGLGSWGCSPRTVGGCCARWLLPPCDPCVFHNHWAGRGDCGPEETVRQRGKRQPPRRKISTKKEHVHKKESTKKTSIDSSFDGSDLTRLPHTH